MRSTSGMFGNGHVRSSCLPAQPAAAVWVQAARLQQPRAGGENQPERQEDQDRAIRAAAIGLAIGSASRPPVATSSPVETTMLEKGSGLALTSVRAPAFPAWAMKRRAAAEQEAADLPGGVAGIDDRHRQQARRRAAG